MPIKRLDKGGKNAKTCRLVIEGDMTIYTAEALKEELSKYLSHSGNLQIDLSKVGEMDSAGAQLLLLAQRETECTERELGIKEPSEGVNATLTLLNLHGRLNLPESAATA